MHRTILLAGGFALAAFLLGERIGATLPRGADPDPKAQTTSLELEFDGQLLLRDIREVTAYNVGVRAQTDDDPCVGASGHDICRLVEEGVNVCAANFVDLGTILTIQEFGECIVFDRMNRRYAHRVDIAMAKDEIGKAREFGIQKRFVGVRALRPGEELPPPDRNP